LEEREWKDCPLSFVLKILPFILNCQSLGTIALMRDQPFVMLHAVFKPQLSATKSFLNFIHIFELDLDICCRKLALSVGVFFLANAEHFV
jgi:hypothetical protein